MASEILTPHAGVKSARAYMYCMSYLLIIPYQHYLFCQCPSKNVGVHILHFDGFLFEILVKLNLVTKVKTSKNRDRMAKNQWPKMFLLLIWLFHQFLDCICTWKIAILEGFTDF